MELMKELPVLFHGLKWARFVYPGTKPGPWFSTDPDKREQFLEFGTPLPGDKVFPLDKSLLVQVYNPY